VTRSSLNNRNWATLSTAFGTGEVIPPLLESIEKGDTEALWNLMDLVVHQGTRFDSSVLVQARLAELALSSRDLYPSLAPCVATIALGTPEGSFPNFFQEVRHGKLPTHAKNSAASGWVARECFIAGIAFSESSMSQLSSSSAEICASAIYATFWFEGYKEDFVSRLSRVSAPEKAHALALSRMIGVALGGVVPSINYVAASGFEATVAAALGLSGIWSPDALSAASDEIDAVHSSPWFDGCLELPMLWVANERNALPEGANALLDIIGFDSYRVQSVLRGLCMALRAPGSSALLQGQVASMLAQRNFGEWSYAELDELLAGAQ